MSFVSCKGCVPPKRHPGCHGNCAEYLAEKAEYSKRKGAFDADRKVMFAIYAERSKKVRKAVGKRGMKYGHRET